MMKYVSQNQLDRWDNAIRHIRRRRNESVKTPGMENSVTESHMKPRLPGIPNSNRDMGTHLRAS